MTSFALALSMGLALASTAQAKDDNDADVTFDATLPVAAQVGAIEKALGSEHYSEISKDDKAAVQQALDRIQTRLGDQDRVDALEPQDRAEVLKDQDVVNSLLARARADSRVSCRRERLTGSNMAQRVCMTTAQRRRAEEASRKAMEDSSRSGGGRP
ncbi:hypothetical protein [Stenotrophomonas sp. NPDC077659]|uniref:hypothetical protein n=1 Tax=Stenotrophomonas sp. NPDC077659 TaxID=3390694 RepID=UPI003D0260B6